MLRDGDWGTCGHMVWVMTALTRNLGYDSRQIVWFTPTGAASLSALENNLFGMRETRLAVEGQVGIGSMLTLRGLKWHSYICRS